MATQTAKKCAGLPRDSAGARPGTSGNIAAYLSWLSAETPDRLAVVVARRGRRNQRKTRESVTFAELDALSNRYAKGLTDQGIDRGMRVLVMVRPGVEFLGLIFALFKMGSVPVMIDPGMGVRRMLECIRSVDLHAFIGVPLAHVIRVLRPGSFETVRQVVTVGRRWFWGGSTLRKLECRADSSYDMVACAADDKAAILFTSGSTGPAKGVVYEHGMFDAQIRMIRTHYGMEPGEIELPTFPLFALFSIAMGMTVVIPDMDPTRPADVDPARIVRAIKEHGVTTTFGSPVLWKRVAAYCVERGIKLPSLRRILIAGAPVPYTVISELHRVLNPDADVHTPFGATEALPVSSISGKEVLGGCDIRARQGGGTCVGRPVPQTEVRIIRITDDPIAEWTDDLSVPNGTPGEIVVSGPVVTKEYFGLGQATALAKIADGPRIWHRMGDIGYRDDRGRIWFYGRKSHRVVREQGTMFTVPCEAIFNEHPHVARSALVGVGEMGRQTPAIVVEPIPGRFPKGPQVLTFWEELLELARVNELTCDITYVLFHPSLPVDVRHNAKIDRERLSVWAADELR